MSVVKAHQQLQVRNPDWDLEELHRIERENIRTLEADSPLNGRPPLVQTFGGAIDTTETLGGI